MAAKPTNQRFKIIRFANPSGKIRWRVTGYAANGRRVRENFLHQSEALARRLELEEDELLSEDSKTLVRTSLTPEQVAAAETAQSELGGRSLAAAVHHYLQLEKRATGHGIGLDEALTFVDGHFSPNLRAMTVYGAIDEFLESRSEREAKTIEHYRNCTRLLRKHCPNRMVHEVKVDDLEKILKPFRNINSAKTYRRGLATFFRWAVRHHLCADNPCARLDPLPANITPIKILTLEDVRKLLAAAVEYSGGCMTASVAIALFAGLRPSELAAITDADILPGRIRVKGGKLRRTLRRSVPIPPNLQQWLDAFPFTGRPSGWNYKLKVLRQAVDSDCWVQDVLRHTSISYQLERDKDEARTAFNNGTSKQMIDQHYRDVVEDPATVEAFWQLTPEAIRKAQVPVALTAAAQPAAAWPGNAKLATMVASQPLTRIASQLGVSDNAVRKRCLKLGIPLPGRGQKNASPTSLILAKESR